MQRSHRLSRREFIRLSTAGLGVALSGPLLTGCPEAIPILDVPGDPTTAPATVAAVRGQRLGDMTRQALDALGGIATIVQPGQTVFIKPNLLSAGLRSDPAGTGECAKPDIALALAQACLEAGAARVTIGDGAQVYEYSWDTLRLLDSGSTLSAEAAKLNAQYPDRLHLACLNRDSPAWDAVPVRRTQIDQLLVSSLAARADRLISVAVLKNHRHFGMSLSMKNLVGLTPIGVYGGGSEDIGRFRLHFAGMEGAFLDIVDALRPDLAIVDASLGVEGYGPWVKPGAGRTVDLRQRLGNWLLLAGTDPVAVDATAMRMVGGDPLRIRYLAAAYDHGLGQARAERISLLGATLNELRIPWAPLYG